MQTSTTSHPILLVCQNSKDLNALKQSLDGKFNCLTATLPKKVYSLIKENPISVVVLDASVPNAMGVELFSSILKIKPNIVRIFVSEVNKDISIMNIINKAQIYRFVQKPWNDSELISIVEEAVQKHLYLMKNDSLLLEYEEKAKELRILNDKLNELAMTDSLTQIANRRAFSKKFNEEIERSTRYHHPILLAMIDVDHFKKFNDEEGHTAGDEALVSLSKVFLSNIRKTDLVARYGGEEFVLMLPETPISKGREICERLRISIEKLELEGKKSKITVSIGVACFPEDGKGAMELLEAADKALYGAKEAGRNRVMSHKSHASFFVS